MKVNTSKERCDTIGSNQNDIGKAVEKLSLLQQKLEDRANGVIKRGRTPTLESIERQCKSILSRQYLNRIITVTINKGPDDIPRLEYVKDRNTGSWWPMHHWTDSKIKVHGLLYCTIALLIRALMFRRVRKAGLRLSMKRVLTELDAIGEVVNIYPRKRRQKTERKQAVLSKLSDVQQQLMSILVLKQEENSILG